MNAGEDVKGDSDNVLSKSRALEVRAEAKVTETLRTTKNLSVAIFDAARFLLFSVFIATAILRFWLLSLTLVLHLVRFTLHILTIPLRTASGANPPQSKQGKRTFASSHVGLTLYYELFKPIEHVWIELTFAARSFWHYTIARKTLVVVLGFFFVLVPLSYLVPRPHTVQILDNNVLNNQSSKLNAATEGYLIHAIDLDDPTQTREYANENAWWLGKVNAQGLKARLVPGRYYKIWVTGLRWWIAPTMYPNIISAAEVDAKGNILEHPSTFIPPATTGH